jgi:GntR family transcriptional regulator, transcriptional repressor for pyruvate dehydrogenase complex
MFLRIFSGKWELLDLFNQVNYLVDQLIPATFMLYLSDKRLLMDHVLENLKEVIAEKPVDIIIKQIKDLLISGQLKPGDKLPPERKLSEKLCVGRTHVREAIRKLEFYGILKTRPQSGTYVAAIGISALESMISDILRIDSYSFQSLVETRVMLEINSIELACERRTKEDLIQMEVSLNNYLDKAVRGINAVDEDFLYHLSIAEAGKNKVLKSLLLIIVPDILSNYSIFKVCDTITSKSLEEHKDMLRWIKEKNAKKAGEVMREHLRGVMDFAKAMVQ